MRRNILSATGTLFLVLFLQSLAWGLVKTGPIDFTLEPILSADWVCYIHDQDLYIRGVQSQPIKIRDSKKAGASITSPQLIVSGDIVFLLWIEKGAGETKMHCRISRDRGKTFEPVQFLETGKGLASARAVIDTKGRICCIGLSQSEKTPFSLHLSLDHGKTFKKHTLTEDSAMTIYNLTPVTTDTMIYLFYSGISEGEKAIGVVPFDLSSGEFQRNTILQETEEGVSFQEAFQVKNQPAIIYKTSRNQIYALEGQAKISGEWRKFTIQETKGLDVARLDSYVWDDGRILAVFSAEDRGKYKQRIYAASSEDSGSSWQVQRIDSKQFDNTRSWLPRIAVDGNNVAVVWEDSRDIRSGIRMKISSDRGKTWYEKDIPVSEGKYYAFRPRISSVKKTLNIAWQQYRDDERRTADIVIQSLQWDKALKMARQKEKPVDIEKKARLLRERVNAYWKGMVKKDHKVTYSIHDPFYRVRVPYDSYVVHRGPMVYKAYNIENVRIQGNEATVKVKVNYEVPKLIVLGRETSIPLTEVVTEDMYLFIDGTWHRKFVDAMSGGSSIDY
ncbi:MAG: glycoside hydrolase [Thermodesulfovibrionales bacterium]|nr:glycoside hydrolase [Thermodesulfovibrionales bacterium]